MKSRRLGEMSIVDGGKFGPESVCWHVRVRKPVTGDVHLVGTFEEISKMEVRATRAAADLPDDADRLNVHLTLALIVAFMMLGVGWWAGSAWGFRTGLKSRAPIEGTNAALPGFEWIDGGEAELVSVPARTAGIGASDSREVEKTRTGVIALSRDPMAGSIPATATDFDGVVKLEATARAIPGGIKSVVGEDALNDPDRGTVKVRILPPSPDWRGRSRVGLPEPLRENYSQISLEYDLWRLRSELEYHADYWRFWHTMEHP